MNQNNLKKLSDKIINDGGQMALRLCRKFEVCRKKIAKYKEHFTFNIKCLDNNVFPKSIFVNNKDKNYLSQKIANKSMRKFLKNRIVICKNKLRDLYIIFNYINYYIKLNLVLLNNIYFYLRDLFLKLSFF